MPAAPTPPSDPSASGAEAAAAPRRAATILGRLTKAVREQNWFAVALEVCIVIAGVVVGFQVTAWGQARADRATEQAYLRQLTGDLNETERLLAEADSVLTPVEIGATTILRSFYEAERPPRDTLLARLSSAATIVPVSPVTGTVEALVATGDLALVRSDSLRAEITSYLGQVEAYTVSDRQMHALWLESFRGVRRGRDRLESAFDRASQAQLDSLARSDPRFPLPAGARRRPFPIRVEAFLSDPEMLAAVDDLVIAQDNIRQGREALLTQTVALRERVTAEIAP